MFAKLNLVIPTIPNDIEILLSNIDIFFLFLPISKIVVIGPHSLVNVLPNDPRFVFIEEGELISCEKVSYLLEQRCNNSIVKRRTGWYVQQFLKMAYAQICEDEFYLLWDSDTIPLKKIEVFDNSGKPYIDYKTEYHKQYFDTIGRILPGYKKEFSKSFIAEHMLVNTSQMKEVIGKIEANEAVAGLFFYEKIINSIDTKDLSGSGFSEFETFGTYIYRNYKEQYIFRRWNSVRHGGFFFSKEKGYTDQQRDWMARNYHAISFEKSDKMSFLSSFIDSPLFLKSFPSTSLDYLSFIQRLIRKMSL